MKIIKTIHATKNKTVAESGSINTPIFSQVSPVGNQGIELVKGFKPKSFLASASTKTIIAPSHERNAAPIATLCLSALFLFVNNTIRKNASRGGRGINQVKNSVA